MDKLRRIAVEISQRLSASSCAATGHISTFAGAAKFRTSHHGRGCEANRATAAEIVANELSSHVPPENHRRRYNTSAC